MNKFISALFISILFLFSFLHQADAQESRDARGFHAIANAGSAEVYVQMGTKETISIEGSDEDVERIETVVQNGILKIRIKRDFSNWNVVINQVKIYITAVKLDALMQSGSGMIESEGEMTSSVADIQLSGSGKISATMYSQSAKIMLSGSGNIVLAGKVGELNVTMAGTGDLNADKLVAKNSKIKIAGNGVAYLHVTESIDAKLIGPGAVKYLGDPSITTNKLGAGVVSKM